MFRHVLLCQLAAASIALTGLAESRAETRARLSVKHSGVQSHFDSYFSSISADGRYVALDSSERLTDTFGGVGQRNVFLRDVAAGTVTQVTTRQSNGFTYPATGEKPAISADGRFVAFVSEATDLVSGDSDTNNAGDAFVWDGMSHQIVRVSVTESGGLPDHESYALAISADGRFVAFTTDAWNMGFGDTYLKDDVFVRDRDANTNGVFDEPGWASTMLVSGLPGGGTGNAHSRDPAMSGDGRYVAFISYVDRLDGPASVDNNNVPDVYVRDMATGTTRLVSVAASGGPSNGGSFDYDYRPLSVSADGRYVAFKSDASNLLATGQDTNGVADIFVRDRDTNTNGIFDEPGYAVTTRVSVSSGGTQAQGESAAPVISSDGRYVAFQSIAGNLVASDTNAAIDVFMRDRAAGTTSRISVGCSGLEANGPSVAPALTGNAAMIVFTSGATNLVPLDTNGSVDIFAGSREAGPVLNSTQQATFPAIQQALNAAVSGQRLHVCPGVYSEDVDFGGRIVNVDVSEATIMGAVSSNGVITGGNVTIGGPSVHGAGAGVRCTAGTFRFGDGIGTDTVTTAGQDLVLLVPSGYSTPAVAFEFAANAPINTNGGNILRSSGVPPVMAQDSDVSLTFRAAVNTQGGDIDLSSDSAYDQLTAGFLGALDLAGGSVIYTSQRSWNNYASFDFQGAVLGNIFVETWRTATINVAAPVSGTLYAVAHPFDPYSSVDIVITGAGTLGGLYLDGGIPYVSDATVRCLGGLNVGSCSVRNGYLQLGGNNSIGSLYLFHGDGGYVLGGSTSVEAGLDFDAAYLTTLGPLSISGGATLRYGPFPGSEPMIHIGGPLTLANGAYWWLLNGLTVDGPLSVVNGSLTFPNGCSPIVLYHDLLGTGEIHIDQGVTLTIDHAVVDLSGQPGPADCGQCPTTDPSQWGTLVVDGTLLVRDATIRSSNLRVRLMGVDGTTGIVNNNILLLEPYPGAGSVGGTVFVTGNSAIQCNSILSDGDRYFDLDAVPGQGPNPLICGNRISVRITQGAGGEQGELLELRTQDYDIDTPGTENRQSGAYRLPASQGYSSTWVLEQLELLRDSTTNGDSSGAKVNLTNRSGFVFEPTAGGVPEALYVKKLKLHPHTVLNVGLQRMYYRDLVDENDNPLQVSSSNPFEFTNHSRIVDYPLLGFSLKTIMMDDQTEFDVRVQKRLRDSADLQPCTCTDTCPIGPPDPLTCIEGSVFRTSWPAPGQPTNGVMRMQTQAAGHPAATSVAAKGAFARAGDENITVAFKYRFCDDCNPNAALDVYLSADPNVSTALWPIATIWPPASGPGSIGSTEFAQFRGVFPRGTLTFPRGTYIELKLSCRNAGPGSSPCPGACVLIDDWDPVACSPKCGDYDASYDLEYVDFLYLLSEYGTSLAAGNTCGDQMNLDSYIDYGDLAGWESQFVARTVLTLCPCNPGTNGCSGAQAPQVNPPGITPDGPLVVAGKAGGMASGFIDKIYPVDPGTHASGTGILEAYPQQAYNAHGFGRLARDPNGAIYQVHGAQGLVQLASGFVAPPQALPFTTQDPLYPSAIVHIGYLGLGDVPISDAAFRPAGDPNIVYVVPVTVIKLDANNQEHHRYLAAAKLYLLDPDPGTMTRGYTLMQLYGQDPHTDPNSNVRPPQYSALTIQKQREIEMDSTGNVYVTSAQADNANDWILIYDDTQPIPNNTERRERIDSWVRGPTAMLVVGDTLYVAPSLSAANGGDTSVHRFMINRGANGTTLSHVDSSVIGNMRHCTAMTADPAGQVWVVGFNAPDYSNCEARVPGDLPGHAEPCFDNNSPLFTTPVIAALPASGMAMATVIRCSDLALPLSAVFIGGAPIPPCCVAGDMNTDGQVREDDAAAFVQPMLDGEGPAPCPTADMNQDGRADGDDIPPFVRCLITMCP